MLRSLTALSLLFLSTVATTVSAQSVASAQPGLIYRAEGLTFLNDDRIAANAAPRLHAKPGDRLRTHRGHCEILLLDTTVLRTGGVSLLEVLELSRDRAVLALVGGAVVADLADNFARETVEVRLPAASVIMKKLGVYRIDMPPQGAPRVTVLQGRALVSFGSKKLVVKKNQRLHLAPGAAAQKLAAIEADSLDRWAANRRVALIEELLASQPDGSQQNRRSSASALESLRAVRRRTEAEIRSSEAADSLWVK